MSVLDHAPRPWQLQEIDTEEGEDWPRHLCIADVNGEEIATIVHRPGPPVPEYKYRLGNLICHVMNAYDPEVPV